MKFWLLAAFVFYFHLSLFASALAEEVKLYIWEEFLSDKVIQRFEDETGHTIKQVYFESEQQRNDVIVSGRGEAYDLFIINNFVLRQLQKQGLIHQFDIKRIPNIEHIDSLARSECGPFGIPYAWGTMGIVYRQSANLGEFNSWAELFDTVQEKNTNFVMPLDDIDTFAFPLLAMHLDPMTSSTKELKQAYQLLNTIKHKVHAMRTAVGYAIEHGNQSKMNLAVAYSGEIHTLSEATAQEDWVYVVPAEGTMLWHECFATVSGHRVKQSTLDFLNFINRPEIAAINAEDVWFATSNKKALDFVSTEYKGDLELFPPEEILTRSFRYKPVEHQSMKVRARMLTIFSD